MNLETHPAPEPNFILYPRLKELRDRLYRLHRMSRKRGESRSMVLEGGTGAGKTALAYHFKDLFSREETIYGSKIPVLYVLLPPMTNTRGLASTMLKSMGEPLWNKGTGPILTERLADFIPKCGVQFVILDDFHHFIDSDTDRVVRTSANWVKFMMKRTKIPFLVIGVETKVTQILDTNPELKRLFSFQEKLEPFTFDPYDEKDLDFALFVKQISKNIVKMDFSEEVSRRSWLCRLHFATGGVVSAIIDLLEWAADGAMDANESEIILKRLYEVFEESFLDVSNPRQNPFTLGFKTPE